MIIDVIQFLFNYSIIQSYSILFNWREMPLFAILEPQNMGTSISELAKFVHRRILRLSNYEMFGQVYNSVVPVGIKFKPGIPNRS